jgi:hypothetical protein
VGVIVAVMAFAIVAVVADVELPFLGVFDDRELIILLLALAVAVGVVVTLEARSRPNGEYRATIAGTLPWVPWTAAILSTALYLAPIGDRELFRENAVAFGVLAAMLLWLAYPLADRRYATADTQSPGWSAALRDRVQWLSETVADGTQVRSETPADERILAIARTSLEQLKADLRKGGMGWVTRDAYMAAWADVHRVEQLLVDVSPPADLVRLAMTDVLRVHGSNIPDAESLERRLRLAASVIDPGSDAFFRTVDVAAPDAEDSPGADTFGSAPDARVEARARAVIRAVHDSITSYRSSLWSELAYARWLLLRTTATAGLVAYLVLALALVVGVSDRHLGTAWAYFLTGAVAGLFLRLRRAGTETSVSDDYGLEYARLYQTPLLSGMAAVIGVVIMASISGATLGDILVQETQPTLAAEAQATDSFDAEESLDPDAFAPASAAPAPDEAEAAGDGGAEVPPTDGAAAPDGGAGPSEQATSARLGEAFDLETYPLGVVIALIFGLTPGLVLDRLGASLSGTKSAIVSSRAGNQK